MAASRARRAIEFLGAHPGEERGAALMLAHSFFMGCATVFFETAASATFLSRFASSYIPWVYIAAAAVNTVTGSVYARMQRSMTFARLMKGTLWFLLLLVVAVRIGLAMTATAWVAFAALVSYRIISSLTDLEYWAVASRIYDVRQAKRLFGLIGTGEVIARTAGAFSVPLLVSVGGVSNLMVLSAAALAMCIALLGAVLRSASPGGTHAKEAKESKPKDLTGQVREIVTSPYLSLVVGVAVLATFGKYFVDFSFLEQVGTLSKGDKELASFLGVFSGLTQTLSLLTRVFVSRPLLNRFGIRTGVLILPLLHAACSAITVVMGVFGIAPQLVFWFVIANQGIYKAFKHPIDNASFKVLYQPLKPEQRLAAQIAVEIIFSPLVVGIAGGIMLLFTVVTPYDPVRFSIVLFVNFVLWVGLARAAGRRYAQKLVEMLKQRIEGNVTFTFDDATTLSILRARLASESPADVCVAIDLLEKAAAPDLADILVTNVSHAAPEVRRYALARLVEVKPEAIPALRQRVSIDPEASVREVAMRAVAISSPDPAGELTQHLADPDPIVRHAAATLLFELEDDESRAAAEKALASFARSPRIDDRVLASKLAGEHGREDALVPLLRDASFVVRRAAMRAAGPLRRPALRALLKEALLDTRFAQAAASALACEGDAIVADLDVELRPETDQRLLRRIVHVYWLIGGASAIARLEKRIAFADVAIRGRIHAVLDRLGYVATGDRRAAVFEVLREEAREAAWALAALRDLRDEPELEALRDALVAEVADAGERAFHLIAFVHDRTTVHRARAHVARGSKEKRAYAHEVLDLLLSPEERSFVLPLLIDASDDARLERLEEDAPQEKLAPSERLFAIASRPARAMHAWTRVLALRAAAEHDAARAREALRGLDSNDPIIEEVRASTLARATGETHRSEKNAMLLIEKILILKAVPMFHESSEELLAEIAGALEIVDVAAGTTIFEKGDAGDSMYIVVTGRVRVLDGESELSVLGEREIFGELALLDPEPRSASVAAVSDAKLFRLDGDMFTQLMAANVDIVRGVLHVLCARLRRTSAEAARV